MFTQTELSCEIAIPSGELSFNLSAFSIPPTSQRRQHGCVVSQSGIGSNFPFLSCNADLYFTYLWNLLVIIILSGRLRSLSKRDRRAGDDAAVWQPSYRGAFSFQRLERVKDSQQRQRIVIYVSPSSLLVFVPLERTVWYCNFLSLSPFSHLQYLSLSFSASIRRLIRPSWLFWDELCWWCRRVWWRGGSH